MAHAQTFAGQMSIKGYLRGLEVARPENCRVLELGCGDGFNLAAMAAIHPGASYTGVDYSAEAIERGRGLMRELGFAQVRLETADIRNLEGIEPRLGEFDYIIAHGVYSWVPADVRDALLALIGRLLAPHGVAFVSYLALPGAYHREAARAIMRFHTRGEQDPAAQVRQARSILGLIAHGSTEPNHYTQWMARELELVENHTGESLFHDELSPVSAPVLFTEFIGHAERHGLNFLSEAECLLPIAPALTPEAREQFRPLEANRVLLEQYLDFIEGRRFRQTLLCRAGGDRRLRPERLDALWLSFQGVVDAGPTALTDQTPLEFRRVNSTSRIRATRPIEKAILLELAERRGEAIAYPALAAAARARMERAGLPTAADFDAELRLYLCHTWLPGLVELSWSPNAWSLHVPSCPVAHPLARLMIQYQAASVFSYTGRFVEVHGVLGRKLLALLDGTRDHAGLLAEVQALLTAIHAEARARGETANLPPPDDPALGDQLEQSLRGLAGLGLLQRNKASES
jgi:SAM-dependent methyltransferase